MPCLLAILALGVPRVVIALLFLFSDYMTKAYSAGLWLLLGFLFMPLTTLAYAFAKNSHGSVQGWYLILVIFAALLDLGIIGGGSKARRVKRASGG